jgi:glycosyltransferase involved in cell wall biosynthesis
MRQSLTDWECVVVDDGSADETAGLVEAWARRDGRIRLVRTERAGLVPALCTGARACRADRIARMDADDLMHRDRLALQLARLDARPDLAAVGCHVRIFPRSSLGPGLRSYEAWLNGIADEHDLRRELFVECPVAHPSLMLRRAVLEAIDYEDRGWPEDYDLLLRWVLAGHVVGVVPRRLLGWRHGPGRLSFHGAAYRQARFTECKASYLSRSFLAAHERYVLWGFGRTGRALRRALEREGKQVCRIVELHPGRVGQRIHGAPVVPPERLLEPPRTPLLVSVARSGPRRQIRQWLTARGFRETVDFICTA